MFLEASGPNLGGSQAYARVGWCRVKTESKLEVQMNIETISAITLRVASMQTSVRFYRDVLGMEVLYGGGDRRFSSLRANYVKNLISI